MLLRRAALISRHRYSRSPHVDPAAPGHPVSRVRPCRPGRCRRRRGGAGTQRIARPQRDPGDPRVRHPRCPVRRGPRDRGGARHAEDRSGAGRPPRPWRGVGQATRWHMVEPGFRQVDRRQHRVPGRRAVGRCRAGIHQRARAGIHRQRQDHPGRRRRRGGRADRPQQRDGHRRPPGGRDLVLVAGPWPVRRRRPGRRGPEHRRQGQRGRLWAGHHAAHDLRGPRAAAPGRCGGGLPRPARGSHGGGPRRPL